jgi:hypothetical protein
MIVALDVLLIIAWINFRSKQENLPSFFPNITSVESSLKYGQQIPEFEAFSLAGERITHSTFKGKILILNFFIPENPHHRDLLLLGDILAKRYREHTVFAAVGQGRLDWLLRKGYDLKNTTIIADRDFQLGRLFKSDSYEGATIIVDANQVVRFASTGLVSGHTLKLLVGRFDNSIKR